jgi:peroxiredoxin Q/BCP
MAKLQIGDRAPDFTLLDKDGQPRSLHDFLGQKVVLAFFVGAFTEACTKEACEFRDSMARFTNLQAQVIGIRVINFLQNKEFAETNYLPYPMLSDTDLEVTKLYGLEPQETKLPAIITVNRSIFVLDKEGVIRYIWASKDPNADPDYDEIQSVLEAIK